MLTILGVMFLILIIGIVIFRFGLSILALIGNLIGVIIGIAALIGFIILIACII